MLFFETCRVLVNHTYKMDLVLVHTPHLIALACIYIASALKDKDTIAWFEELCADMNAVFFFQFSGVAPPPLSINAVNVDSFPRSIVNLHGLDIYCVHEEHLDRI